MLYRFLDQMLKVGGSVAETYPKHNVVLHDEIKASVYVYVKKLKVLTKFDLVMGKVVIGNMMKWEWTQKEEIDSR